MAARQAARRRLWKPVGQFPQRKQRKFSIQPFSKGWWGGGAAPLLALRRGRNTPKDTKRSGRAAKTSRWDVLAKGNPIKGFPAGRSPAKPTFPKEPAPARRNDKRSDSLARVSDIQKTAESETLSAGTVFAESHQRWLRPGTRTQSTIKGLISSKNFALSSE